MFLDSATLQDLEIVPMPRVRGTTLWSLVDRTRTRIGREVLRERLLAPPHSAEEILALQHAHRALASEASAYRIIVDNADPDRVEGYLRSNWQLSSGMPALIRFRKWYRQYLQDVEHGQGSVTTLLEAAADLRRRFAVADTAMLAELGEEIAALLATP